MCLRTETRQLLGRREVGLNQLLSTQGSGILKLVLTLTLLKAGIFLVDDVELAITTHNLAIDATLFDGGFDFHDEQKLTSLKQGRPEVLSYLCLSVLPANNRRTTTRITKLKTIPAGTTTN